jgi:hypothetical protein
VEVVLRSALSKRSLKNRTEGGLEYSPLSL